MTPRKKKWTVNKIQHGPLTDPHFSHHAQWRMTNVHLCETCSFHHMKNTHALTSNYLTSIYSIQLFKHIIQHKMCVLYTNYYTFCTMVTSTVSITTDHEQTRDDASQTISHLLFKTENERMIKDVTASYLQPLKFSYRLRSTQTSASQQRRYLFSYKRNSDTNGR